MKRWDIIIAGGGPAGLALAADLSRDFSVLVVEMRKAGTTTRSWYTYQDRIQANGLQKAVVATPRTLVFSMDKDASISCRDRFALIDEHRALQTFKERAEAEGCNVLSNTRVKDFRYRGEGITLITNRGEYEGDLLIDCMGATSPIVARRGLQKNFNIWLVYGRRVRNASFPDSGTIGFYRMPQHYNPRNDATNYMFGIYPKSKTSGDVFLFNYYDQITEPEMLKPLFEKAVRELLPKYKSTSILRGWIYTGELKTYALDNVLFFGDAGGLTPPAIGMGFNEVLRKHRNVSERIRRAMHQRTLSAHHLSDILLDYRSSPSHAFLRICQRYFYYGNTEEEWKRGITMLQKAGKVFVRKWMRNELTLPLIQRGMKSMLEVVGFTGLARMLPVKEYIQFSLDSMGVVGSSVLEDAHLAFHQQHGEKPSELCRRCRCRHAAH